MNFIDATIKRNGGAPSAVTEDGTTLPLSPEAGWPGRPENRLWRPP